MFPFTPAVVWRFCFMTVFEGSKLPIYNFAVVGNMGSTPDGFLCECLPETDYIVDVYFFQCVHILSREMC